MDWKTCTAVAGAVSLAAAGGIFVGYKIARRSAWLCNERK